MTHNSDSAEQKTKYKSKDKIIDAVQWTGTELKGGMPEWLKPFFENNEIFRYGNTVHVGVGIAFPDYWIVKHQLGNIEVFSPELFVRKFDPIPEQQGDKAAIEQFAILHPTRNPLGSEAIWFENGFNAAAAKYTNTIRERDQEIEQQTALRLIAEKAGYQCQQQIASLQSELERVRLMVGAYESWSLPDVIKKLSEATDILLHEKNFDRHGWEEMQHAWLKSKEYLQKIDQPVSKTYSIEQIEQAYQEWEFNDSIDIPFTEYLSLKQQKEGI